jgi:hypothetical protein
MRIEIAKFVLLLGRRYGIECGSRKVLFESNAKIVKIEARSCPQNVAYLFGWNLFASSKESVGKFWLG